MSDFLTKPILDAKIPVGRTVASAFDWLQDTFITAFDGLEAGLRTIIGLLASALQTPHPFAVIAAFCAITWVLQRRWVPVLIVAFCALFALNQGYWMLTMQTLTLVIASCVVCMGVGVPLGIYAAHHPRFYRALTPVLDLMQTLPVFVYLIPVLVLFGLGMVPGLVATVIFAMPAAIRLTELGIRSTPTALSEAATAFGATTAQRIWKVELPFAFPQIMAGLNQTIMLSLSMVVIAGLVGAPGLGVSIVRALNTVNASLGFEAGAVIVAVAIMLDRMLRVEVKR
ncbi:glycine betaine/proline transport system permease protein [Roseinatronobacter thiooxidans]|uniref:Glycine betaine/proline transport system permease protein n=1 Tax=Roseinatronobacter thiooxidans TaxID=121821 RepID=A0A2W7QGS2_9RHOB|nr:choline ABC transporter permease subunit [Roseinatronobacter thiooxidans]PZX47341.1 glycine betaine/proline transport system permease protein [Roseinatronobacter thiooxidans]